MKVVAVDYEVVFTGKQPRRGPSRVIRAAISKQNHVLKAGFEKWFENIANDMALVESFKQD
jgi:hypothetical protein